MMKQRQYISFVVFAPEELTFPEHFLMLGEGVNAFNLSLEDPEEFKQKLLSHGVRIDQANRLDDHEPIEPDPGIMLEAMPGIPLLRS